ncbi:YPO3983 family protein [Erwinia sp. AnSW2-5]|uniref:YPO3983 family protein n=1 Tax=Erwinia sp. AnSW2-5 TaxID=3367692 RepID=UPI0038583442
MTALPLPCTLFTTQNRMDDHNAKDMQCGELTAEQLKTRFRLNHVSGRVDPFTLTKFTTFNRSSSMYRNSHGASEKISRQECARILFDEFRDLSRTFSLYGPYRHLIGQMITHMQNGNGAAFTSMHLDAALKEQILNDKSKNSTYLILKETFSSKIDWENKYYPSENKDELRDAISRVKLPKFDRFKDNINGMGITVHDTWATHITLKSLQINNDSYRAVVHYKVQDHFGLDNADIFNTKFKDFIFFRIWFVLQRYDKFGFKPFMTNMEATVEITGGRNERKK